MIYRHAILLMFRASTSIRLTVLRQSRTMATGKQIKFSDDVRNVSLSPPPPPRSGPLRSNRACASLARRFGRRRV